MKETGNIKVYNKDKTKELFKYDLDKGYLVDDELVINHIEVKGQEEEGHYETIAEYENGGKDVAWIIDKPYIEHEDAWKEVIPIKVYIEYSENEIKKQNLEKEITKTKELLSNTDYMTLKYVDGLYTDEEYQPIKENREHLRKRINSLEEELSKIEI